MFSIQLPIAVIRNAAITASYEAEEALEGARLKLRSKLQMRDVVTVHRTVKVKQEIARSLARQLRKVSE